MLRQLYIRNYTLIDTLDIQLHSGFSVITGETGAGKSIILGAIALLLGQRADPKAIKQGTDRCVIEAHFDLSRYQMKKFFDENDIDYAPEDTIIRRELTIAGKSRAFVNDTPVSLSLLKDLGEQLVDVHSQHQNLLLNKHDFQLSVVDILADDKKQLDSYNESYHAYQNAKKQLEQLQKDIEQNRRNADFLSFQYNELSNARLIEDEQIELEQRSETMTHSEDIKKALYEADNALSSDETGVISNLRHALSSLRNIQKVFSAVEDLAERMDSAYIELEDIASEVSSHMEEIDFDPSELDTVNNRLDLLYSLQQKYHVDNVKELIVLRDKLQHQLSDVENSEETLAEHQQRCRNLENACKKQADVLTKIRKQVAKLIEKEMLQRLVLLGMPHVRFSIEIQSSELTHNGQDKVAFLFSANTSTPLQPIAQVASGGEIARVMLSLKAMISGAMRLPTIIFDEIDTGVSGRVAEQMAQIMQEMGLANRQVISITHLPQIAALGTAHYKVSKHETATGTTTFMTELTPDERVREIAQMLSGSDITKAAIQNAKELLKQKQ